MGLKWTTQHMPPQRGRRALITGANSGTGFAASRALARQGATVVMACRNPARGEAAAARIREDVPGAVVEVRTLDLASLESVRALAESMTEPLDLLLNNAGIMALPLEQTADGFELQFGTNHLGHFALTGLLLEPLKAADSARVVTMTSLMHRNGVLDLDDPNCRQRKYDKWAAYRQSKLANILFGFELQRRLSSLSPISLVSHPGVASTELALGGARAKGSATQEKIMRFISGLVGQSAERGALPMLYAATAAEAQGGRYYGPDGFREMRGFPAPAKSSAEAQDKVLADRLWALSEQLTGVHYGL